MAKFRELYPNVKIPLTEEMFHYYIDLGFTCFIIDEYFHISNFAICNNGIVSFVKPKMFNIDDIRYILSINCNTHREFKFLVDYYVDEKYYNEEVFSFLNGKI